MNEIKKLNNFIEFLNNLDKDILIDLLAYLKNQKYDAEIIMLFLDSFKAIYDHNDVHKVIEPTLEDPDDYAKRYIEILNKIGEVNFIRNINDDEYFLSYVVKSNSDIKYGYIEDKNGCYRASLKPTHTCEIAGCADIFKNKVDILFDDVSKKYPSEFPDTIFHELSHIKYGGFVIPFYAMNYNNLSALFDEGYVCKKARRVNSGHKYLSNPPYALNKYHSHEFEEYRILRYLYFKFEFLLDQGFMDYWISKKESMDFLSKIREKIDEEYGSGTFAKLYEYTQLVLCIIGNLSEAELRDLLHEKETDLRIYGSDNPEDKQNVLDHREELYKRLTNYDCFIESYERYNANASTDEKILTEDEYRSILQDFLKKETNIINDINLFKDITNAEINVCNKIINNKDYAKEVITDLELLMADCILKDIDKGYSIEYIKERLNLYNHYVFPFNCYSSSMKKVKTKFDYISFYINTLKTFEGTIVKVKKQ